MYIYVFTDTLSGILVHIGRQSKVIILFIFTILFLSENSFHLRFAIGPLSHFEIIALMFSENRYCC